jgi:hypothetical protein
MATDTTSTEVNPADDRVRPEVIYQHLLCGGEPSGGKSFLLNLLVVQEALSLDPDHMGGAEPEREGEQ